MTLVVVPNDCNVGQMVELPVPGRSDPLLGQVADVTAPPSAMMMETVPPTLANTVATVGATGNVSGALVMPATQMSISNIVAYVLGGPTNGIAGLVYRRVGASYEFLGATPQYSLGTGPALMQLPAPVVVSPGETIFLGVWAPTGMQLLSANGIATGALVGGNQFRAWSANIPTYAGALANILAINVAASSFCVYVGGGS